MNHGIFFEILKNAPDDQTILNTCQAYPEYSWEPRSPYWLKLIQDRFGHQLTPDFKKLYLDYVQRFASVSQFFILSKKYPQRQYYQEIPFSFKSKLLDYLFSITDPSFKISYHSLLREFFCSHLHFNLTLQARSQNGLYYLDLYNEDYDGTYLVVSSKVDEKDLQTFLLQLS